MSYDVSLNRNGHPVTVPRFQEGGTYAVGGSTESSLNITYNYSAVYEQYGFSLRDLAEMTARDTLCLLTRILSEIGTSERTDNYWDATPGNAGHALAILIGWAAANLDATWQVH